MNAKNSTAPRYWAIVPASGVGARMNLAFPKQYLLIHGHPLLSYSINNLTQHPDIVRVVVVLQDQDPHWCQQSLTHAEKVITAVGGESRMQSVLNGLRALSGLATDNDWILVHDAARPCLAPDVLNRLMLAGGDVQGGVALGLPVRDALKLVDDNHHVGQSLDRHHKWQSQTPQMFRYKDLLRGLEVALSAGVLVADEAEAMKGIGVSTVMVMGDPMNIKVTYPEDVAFIKACIKKG